MRRLLRLVVALSLGLLGVAAGMAGLHRPTAVSRSSVPGASVRLTSTSTALPAGCGSSSGTAAGSLPSLLLAGQTSWAQPGGQFALDLSPTGVTAASTSSLAVYVEVFDQLHSRSDFDQTLCNQIPTALIQTFGPVPLDSLASDPGHPGDVVLPITVDVPGVSPPPTSSPASPVRGHRAGGGQSSGNLGKSATTGSAGGGAGGTTGGGNTGGSSTTGGTSATGGNTDADVLTLDDCASGCAGVYPVQVLLEPEDGTHVLSELTTQLVLTEPSSGSKPLSLAWELPVTAPAAMTARGVSALPPGASASWAMELARVPRDAQVPLTLAPSPITLAALSASTAPSDRRTLSKLATWAAQPSHQVLLAPYGQVSVSSLAGSGLSAELAPQLQAGASVLRSALGVEPGTSTWLSADPLTQAGLAQLAELPGQPVSQIVVSDPDLAPLPEQSAPQITPTQPFALDGPFGSHVEAVTADPGLASHLTDGPDAVLAAHQLLADLAMVYFDAPNSAENRGVVLETPPSWEPDSSFLSVALGALASSPIIQPVTLSQLFEQTPESVIEPYGGVLVRQLATPSPGAPRLPASAIRASRVELDAFVSTLGSDHPAILANMDDLILAAESTDLPPAERTGYLDDLSKLVQDQFASVKLQTDTVTLTALNAQLPVTITSDVAYPVNAVLEIASDKLGFVNPGSERQVTLSQQEKTIEFAVRVRATGKFPVEVTLVSPDHGLVLATSRFAVRSSAFSPVAIGLTVAAGLFLAAWWGRTLLRGRRNRNRHLVPAGPSS